MDKKEILRESFSIEEREYKTQSQESLINLLVLVAVKALPLLIGNFLFKTVFLASLGNSLSLTITMIFLARATTDPYMYGGIGKDSL